MYLLAYEPSLLSVCWLVGQSFSHNFLESQLSFNSNAPIGAFVPSSTGAKEELSIKNQFALFLFFKIWFPVFFDAFKYFFFWQLLLFNILNVPVAQVYCVAYNETYRTEFYEKVKITLS